MSIEMTRIEIVGLKSSLHNTIRTLRHLGSVQIDDVTDSPDVMTRPMAMSPKALRAQEELSLLAAQVEGLLDALGGSPAGDAPRWVHDCPTKARAGVAMLMPKVQALTTHRDELQAELASLPRYEATLRKLLPIIPPSASEPGNISVGVLVDRVHMGALDLIGRQALELTGGRAELVTADVDASTRAMMIVFSTQFADEIESLLGREDVSRLRLPTGFDNGPPDVLLAAMRRRLVAIPEEIEAIERNFTGLAAQWGEQLAAWRATLRDEIQSYHVLSHVGETDMTFVLVGWCPAKDVERVQRTLRDEVGETVLLHKLPLTRDMKERAPVVLRNPPPARPFESLVGLLALPRYGGVDPTRLMALFLPIFFGMMLGDVGYGLLLLAISLGLLHKFKTGIARDVLIVLAMGAGWTMVFGILFGEAFGALGEHLGMHALWFDRANPQYVAGLLLMTLAVGAGHIMLGLVLGVWEAIRERSRSHLLERSGMLVGLMALFGIVGVLVDFLPHGFMTLSVAGLIVGIVLVGASLGWLGLLMGPIEFLGLIGNVLSYLRIAAIGLASVYLAKVANDMAGMVGNLIVGVIVAVLLHALNLVMGAFSPTIHSLRLHYVEFFRKFYEGGGRPYQPFKSQLYLDLDSSD